ncbi:universal stress protein [Mangrovimonas aestuarii]|uniref:universal stress protein n=1 Tax=Mangrovimonas aestuarii TaxID=3018443 RepID=UPI002377DD7F|nr:universal stress protein [Mangrovimonas aestuarii]
MSTFIYATDCSQHAVPALQYAHLISQKMDAKLAVLNVYSIPPISISVSRAPKQVKRLDADGHEQAVLKYCRENIEYDLDKLNVTTEAIENTSVVEAVLKRAKQLEAELIIVGRKDEYSKRGMFAGDIALTLIEKSRIPLLITPNTFSKKQIDTIVYASDLEDKDIEAIYRLSKIAKVFDAKIHVFHVSTNKEYAGSYQMEWFKEMLTTKINYDKLLFHTSFTSNIYEELNNYLNTSKADLLVMLEREGIGLFGRFFHEDLVKRMEAQINIPLLCFNDRAL